MKVSLIFLVVFLATICVLGSSASQLEENEELVRVARADSRPYLPRPTPPRPVYIRPRGRRGTCSNSVCRAYCKSRHPSYSGRCVNGNCDCS